MRFATAAALSGGHFVGPASYLVAEYAQRKRFAELGYTSPIRDLPAWKSEAFSIISTEIDKLQAQELKKSRGK